MVEYADQQLTGIYESKLQYIGKPSNCNNNTSKRFELGRLETFKDWIYPTPNPWTLVRCGFYSTHNGDEVECSDCFTKIKNWSQREHPFIEHYKANKRCIYVQKYAALVSTCWSSPNAEIQLSFYDKQHYFSQKTTDLAYAGFYYDGPEDKVKCSQCTIILKGWEKPDIPICEHLLWSPKCPYAISCLEQIAIVLESNDLQPRNRMTEATKIQNGEMSYPKKSKCVEVDAVPEYTSCVPCSEASNIKAQDKNDNSQQKTNQAQIDAVVFMDFDRKLVEQIASRHFLETGREFPDAMELYQAVMDYDYADTKTHGIQQGTVHNGIHQGTSQKGIQQGTLQKGIQQGTLQNGIQQGTLQNGIQQGTLQNGIQQGTLQNEIQQGTLQNGIQQGTLQNGVQGGTLQNVGTTSNPHMDDVLRCKICLDNQIQITFQPCGHFMSCKQCATMLNSCPICRSDICSSINTFVP